MSVQQALTKNEKCLQVMMAQGEQLLGLQNGPKSLQKEHEVAEENVREIAIALTKLLRAFNTILTSHDAAKRQCPRYHDCPY